jgi:hypothetical protein
MSTAQMNGWLHRRFRSGVRARTETGRCGAVSILSVDPEAAASALEAALKASLLCVLLVSGA